jgi:hypothetical protein
MASGGVWCVFQVFKTAQSRERTERTLLKALSQLPWPDKGREVWFFLGRKPRKGLSLAGFSCSAALAENNDVRLSSRKVACTDRRDPSLLISHYRLLHPSHRADKR